MTERMTPLELVEGESMPFPVPLMLRVSVMASLQRRLVCGGLNKGHQVMYKEALLLKGL